MNLPNKRKKEIQDEIEKHIQVDDTPNDTLEWVKNRYRDEEKLYAVLVIGYHIGVKKQLNTCIKCVKDKDKIATGPNM